MFGSDLPTALSKFVLKFAKYTILKVGIEV